VADTRVQLEVEDWVRLHWMPKEFGTQFHRERLPLTSGGVFDFDAASVDRRIAATISTSGATTASGKSAVGKLLKIRSDMFFLLLSKVERRLVVLTENDMYDRCLKEREGGRVPKEIEFFCATIPAELQKRLQKARSASSEEVSPQ
jgi:hypothetical protein